MSVQQQNVNNSWINGLREAVPNYWNNKYILPPSVDGFKQFESGKHVVDLKRVLHVYK